MRFHKQFGRLQYEPNRAASATVRFCALVLYFRTVALALCSVFRGNFPEVFL